MKKTTTVCKTTITAFLILVSVFAITSCGQKSAEQEAREQQQHDDSLKAAIIAEMNQKMQPVEDAKAKSISQNDNAADNPGNTSNQDASELVTRRQANHLAKEENEITDAKLALNKLNILLVNAKSKLEVETNELTRAEQFHLGRLKGQREQEIRNQDLRVQAYQNYVQKIQEAIIQEHEQTYSLDVVAGFFHMVQNDVRLTPMHLSLYFALLGSWIQNNYQSPFSITRKLMMQAAKIKSTATYHKCMAELNAYEYIKYLPSYHPAIGSTVYLNDNI